MHLPDILKNGTQFLKSNSPELLTGAAVLGVVTTGYLAAKAAFTAKEIVQENEKDDVMMASLPNRRAVFLHHAQHTWKLYVPAGVAGVVTIACIVGASKASAQRTTAAVTAYSLTERAFNEYREKVVEEIGKNKEEKIRGEVAQEVVTKTSTPQMIIVDGTGHSLCCELYTRRYFRSDMETLRKSMNTINARVNAQLYVPLDEFYDLVGLEHTSVSDKLGWDSEKQMDLVFAPVISESGEPCLAFDYNYVKPL